MTTVNNTTPPVDPNASTPDDELANNELYQQFLAREAQSEGLNVDPEDTPVVDEANEGDESDSTAGAPAPVDESEAGSVGGGSVAPSASPTDASPYTIDGQDFTPDEMRQLIGAARWAGQLNPLQAAYIDGVLSGDIQVDPSTIPGLNLTPQGTPIQPQSSQVPPQPVDDYEYADPRLKQELDDLRNQVAQFSQTQQQLAQQSQLTQRAAIEAQIQDGVTQFQTRFGMSDADKDELLNSTVLAQVLPSFAQTATPDVAIQQAMEMLYWNTPKFRDAHIQQQQVNGGGQQVVDVNDDSSEPVVDMAPVRQRKMSALASSGGSVPRVAPPTKLTKQERQKAMANEVAAAMNGSQG